MHTLMDNYCDFSSHDIVKFANILGYNFDNDSAGKINDEISALYLSKQIYNNPSVFLDRLSKFELSMLDFLINEGNSIIELDNEFPISAAIYCKIVSCDLHDDKPDSIFVSMSEDMRDVLRGYIKESLNNCRKNKTKHFEQIIIGLLNIYGVMPTEELKSIFISYFENLSQKEASALFESVCKSSALLTLCTSHDYNNKSLFGKNKKSLMHSPLCKEVESLSAPLNNFAGITSFKKYSIEEVTEAGALPVPLMPNPHRQELMQWMTGKKKSDKWDAEEIVFHLWRLAQNPEFSSDSLADDLINRFKIHPISSEIDKITNIVKCFSKNCSQWIMKGYSLCDVEQMTNNFK